MCCARMVDFIEKTPFLTQKQHIDLGFLGGHTFLFHSSQIGGSKHVQKCCAVIPF